MDFRSQTTHCASAEDAVSKKRGHPRKTLSIRRGRGQPGNAVPKTRQQTFRRCVARASKNHEKRHESSFLAQFRADRATTWCRISSSVWPRRSETKSSGRGPWDVGLCVVCFSPYRASGEYRAECLGLFVVCLPSHHGGHMRGFGS